MDENQNLPKVEITKQPPAINQPAANTSPLDAYYRQPKIYIKLPSNGEYYPEGSLDKSEDGTYAVFSMTAKDELMFKTPDALLSGQSTVEVIQSCIPAIKDAWKVPSIDVDAILVAIRIATYGDTMDVDTECPKCKEDLRYDFSLTDYLEKLGRFDYPTQVNIGELLVHLKPYTYKEVTRRNLDRIEQEKIYKIINDNTIDEEEKINRFGASFVKLTELTIDTIADTIYQIDTPQGSETDKDKIKNFITNAPKEIFEQINKHLQGMREQLDLRMKGAVCSACQHTFDVAVTMDQADFFNARS